MKTINPNQLASELMKDLRLYNREVIQKVQDANAKVGEDGANELKQVMLPKATSGWNARPSKRREWKKYSKSWAYKDLNGANIIDGVIHNKKHYRLTHLLENGHATRDGKFTRGFKHIEPIYKETIKKYEEEVLKKLGEIK